MAGDWIKVEKASANKPETLKIARMLGINRREAFGLLVEFWSWLDSNCVDGVVDGVVDADVDALMSCPDLSALLVLVGWVKFDATAQQMRVVNFDRHNGETSKNRALKSERQAKWRAKSVDGHVDATPSTREEKRREDIDTSLRSVSGAPPKKAALTEPNEEHERIATAAGVSCKAEFQKFRDWLRSSGRSQRDEAAGFRNWLRKAGEFRARDLPRKSVHDERAGTVAAMMRPFTKDPDEPTDITAEAQRIA